MDLRCCLLHLGLRGRKASVLRNSGIAPLSRCLPQVHTAHSLQGQSVHGSVALSFDVLAARDGQPVDCDPGFPSRVSFPPCLEPVEFRFSTYLPELVTSVDVLPGSAPKDFVAVLMVFGQVDELPSSSMQSPPGFDDKPALLELTDQPNRRSRRIAVGSSPGITHPTARYLDATPPGFGVPWMRWWWWAHWPTTYYLHRTYPALGACRWYRGPGDWCRKGGVDGAAGNRRASGRFAFPTGCVRRPGCRVSVGG